MQKLKTTLKQIMKVTCLSLLISHLRCLYRIEVANAHFHPKTKSKSQDKQNALSLTKRNQIKTRQKKAKTKFLRSFIFHKSKENTTFQKCSKYY